MDDRFDKENIEAETRYPRIQDILSERNAVLCAFLRSIIQSCPDGR